MTAINATPPLESVAAPEVALTEHTLGEEDGLTTYPQALALQEAILEDRELFTKLLQDLTTKLQTAQPKKYRPSKYRVPIVAGKDLSLHDLYTRVTAHGGVIAVTAENKWPEIITSFNFPAKVNLSAIKRIYSSLLWHFEQVYQHKSGGQKLHEPPELPAGAVDPALQDGLPTRPARNRRGTSLAAIIAADNMDSDQEDAAAAANGNGSNKHTAEGDKPAVAGKDAAAAKQQQQQQQRNKSSSHQQQQRSSNVVVPAKTPELVGFMKTGKSRRDLTGQAVTGRVDARFDCGYFVSLNIAGQAFSGILYCPTAVAAAAAAGANAQAAAAARAAVAVKREDGGSGKAAAAAAGANGSGSGKREAGAADDARGGKRRRQQSAALDPNSASKPKSAKTAFNFFAAEQWGVVKAELGPNAVPQEISRAVGERWNKTTDAERQPYIEKSLQDKSRFEQQMADWRQGLESPGGAAPPAAAAAAGATPPPLTPAAAVATGDVPAAAAAADPMDVDAGDAVAAAHPAEQHQYKHKLKLKIGSHGSHAAKASDGHAAAAAPLSASPEPAAAPVAPSEVLAGAAAAAPAEPHAALASEAAAPAKTAATAVHAAEAAADMQP